MANTKQFDPDVALDRALETFWSRGYEATSMCDLLEHMGIQKGSFYATYSSKHQVFLDAIERYAGRRLGEFEAEARARGPREAIDQMFRHVARECAGEGRDRGCFVINSALELAPSDEQVGRVVRKAIARHEKLLADLVAKGQSTGEIGNSDDPREVARTLFGLIVAMRVYARAGLGPAYPKALQAQAGAILDG